ncbi:MAG: TRSP domain-containing protein, partial [Ruminococcus sp.]|nr:TRSP domain-containing protein [Ruminococcus sp.]
TDERRDFFKNNNIFFESLFDVQWTDEMLEKDFNNLTAPSIMPNVTDYSNPLKVYRFCFDDTRYLVNIKEYLENCIKISQRVMKNINFFEYKKVLFLGTEECMFPSVFTAKFIEDYFNIQAFCHSTTRSPIAVCTADNYPIHNGYKIYSFYDSERINYIYNLDKYDAAIIISDSYKWSAKALYGLDNILDKHDIKQRFYFLGD